MPHARIMLMSSILVVAFALPAAAQTPADSTVTDTTVKKSRFGGLMNRAKQVAGNKAVQGAVKGAATNVACNAVPGAALAAAAGGGGPCQNTLMGGLMTKTGLAGAAANMANGKASLAAAKAMGSMSGTKGAAAAGALGALSGTNGTSQAAAIAAASGMSQAAAMAAAARMMPNGGAMPSTSGMLSAISGLRGKSGGKNAPPAPAATVAVTAAAPASLWVNYDFVPGPNTIFYSDFTDDKVGNFPARLQFAEGNLEVAELGGQRVLRATSSSKLSIPLPVVLPERFTIELDVINRPSLDGADFHLRGSVGRVDDAKTSIIGWGSDGVSLLGGGGGEVKLVSGDAMRQRYKGKPAHIRIMGDGNYIKVYLDEKRMANVPNANFERSKLLHLFVDARGEDNAAYISRIRVAESRVSLYDDMMSGSGRVATQGLLFNSGSAVLNPESAPTLREISSMLVLHPELRLRIEGYTDNVGAKDANLALSTQRAAAVKAALVSGFQIPANRLDSKGFGDSKPARPNDTPEGRQSNRRVELVKM